MDGKLEGARFHSRKGTRTISDDGNDMMIKRRRKGIGGCGGGGGVGVK
jgi:hypothetical protein